MTRFEMVSIDGADSMHDAWHIHDNELEDIQELMNYAFAKTEELGSSLQCYNGAVRIDVATHPKCCVVKNSYRFKNVVKYMEKISNVTPSFGLEIKAKSSSAIYVHFLLEYPDGGAIGVFYFDHKRSILTNNIHQVDRCIREANLDGAIIVYNQIGIPAKNEINRINGIYGQQGKISSIRYSEIEEYLEMYD